MADILNQIDAALADVSECFCGCKKQLKADGPSPWFVDEVCQSNWARRRSMVRSSSEEESAEPEAVVEAPALGERQFREAFAEIAAERRAPVVDVRQPTSDFARDVAAFRRDWVMFGSRYQPVTAGEAAASAPPVDEPEEPATFVLRRRSPEDRQAYLAEQRAERVAAGASAEWLEMFDMLAAAPPVAAAPEPGPDGLRHAVSREEIQQLWDQMVDWPEEPEPDEPVDVHRYECPHSRCDWTKVALDRNALLDLAEAHELEQHFARQWWRRKPWRWRG